MSTLTPQPTSRMCFVCGRENPTGLHLKFYEDHQAEQVLAEITIPEAYQGYPGIAHGGIVAAILDEVSGRAVMMHQEQDYFWVTAKLEVRYRCPTPTETPLTAVGWVVGKRDRFARVAGELRLPDGTVTADVEAVVAQPREDVLKDWSAEQRYWVVEE